MLSGIYAESNKWPFMFSVVMLSVIMLNVVAPELGPLSQLYLTTVKMCAAVVTAFIIYLLEWSTCKVLHS
jgi:hypothetical protein